MMHFCKSNFQTILETPGLLIDTLKSHFAPSKFLYDDIKGVEGEFKSYILSLIDLKHENAIVEENPFELMKRRTMYI